MSTVYTARVVRLSGMKNEAPQIGTVIVGRHCAWEITGEPIDSYVSTFDGKTVFKVPAICRRNGEADRRVILHTDGTAR